MKKFPAFVILLLTYVFAWQTGQSQIVLLNNHFQTTILPDGVTSNGTISTTKAADGVCSQGMIQVNAGQFIQVDLPGCAVLSLNAKSTSSTARVVAVKYRKRYETTFTTLSPSLSIQLAATFSLSSLFPVLITTDSISVRIEAAGNIQIHDLYAEGNAGKSSAAEITAFKIQGQSGNETIFSGSDSISIKVPLGTNLTGITPQQITISPKAVINPDISTPLDFNNLVKYTVTAEDGTTVRQWKVKTEKVASSAKEITAFRLANNQIGEAFINSAAGTVTVYMPIGSNLTSLMPVQLTLSNFASVSPLGSLALDFSTPVIYTVTAQDNSIKAWTILVELIDPNAQFTDYEAEDALFTGKTDNVHANYSGTGFIDFAATGENFIQFTVCEMTAGNKTAKFRYSIAKDEVRRGTLYVNDALIRTFDFPRTAAFDVWAEEIALINLPAGVSRIKLTWDSTDGPNLDKLMLSGEPCNAYTLSVSATNNGKVTLSPERKNARYFENESVTLSAENLPALLFEQWSGDLNGSKNPEVVVMQGNKNISANFRIIPTFKLNTKVNGVGVITLNPSGGEYPVNTIVTLSAQSVLGSSFSGWQGDASGSNPSITLTMDGEKNVTANFSSPARPDFERVVGFASISGDGFTGPVTGGQCAPDSLIINGPTEFNKLCEALYNRQRAFRENGTVGGIKKAPLVILLKSGIYDGSQSLSTDGAKAFGNSMLDIAEQGNLTFAGDQNVVFKIGINVKRSWNVLLRNMSFFDYQDDGINIGYPETHHIWVDHCTFGHPTTLPANKEIPDGGCDIKDGASYVTVSWCKFQNHWKTSLNGHSDNNGATDAGRLKITYYCNYFYSTNSRNPRVRFGQVHVLNNFYENSGLGRSGQLGYGIAASNNAQVVAEGNFFLDTRWPMFADRTTADFTTVYGANLESPTGNKPCFGIKAVNNAYDDGGLTQSLVGRISPSMLNPGGMSIKFDTLTTSAFTFNPSDAYDYEGATYPASVIRTLVPLYAGADKTPLQISCNTLPFKLTDFSGKVQQQNHLYWNVTGQSELQNFEVQRSPDGIRFSTIGVINAAPATSSYRFIDSAAITGNCWYKLILINREGTKTFSKIILLKRSLNQGLTANPNPAFNSVQISHPLAGAAAFLFLYNTLGHKIIKQKVPAGLTLTTINLNGLPTGTYWLVYECDGKRINSGIMKL